MSLFCQFETTILFTNLYTFITNSSIKINFSHNILYIADNMHTQTDYNMLRYAAKKMYRI